MWDSTDCHWSEHRRTFHYTLQQQFNLPLSEYLRYLFLLSQAVIDLHYCFELRL